MSDSWEKVHVLMACSKPSGALQRGAEARGRGGGGGKEPKELWDEGGGGSEGPRVLRY